jgi:acetyltransferase-like isoleucine patch superfamily enzyme
VHSFTCDEIFTLVSAGKVATLTKSLASSARKSSLSSLNSLFHPFYTAKAVFRLSVWVQDMESNVSKIIVNSYLSIAPDVRLGRNVKLSKFINLYGCEIGDETKIGAFVEVQKNAIIGKHCKISSHTFICEGVTIEDNVFVGHGVTFINDSYPRATAAEGQLQTEADWKVERTLIKKGASIGSGATILSSISIGENAIVGAGSVVTKDIPPNTIVAGNPARVLRHIVPTLEMK